MFKNSNLYGLLKEDSIEKVVQIKIDRKTQAVVNEHFGAIYNEYIRLHSDIIAFEGSYKPDHNQLFEIDNFTVNAEILQAINATESVDLFNPTAENIKELKFIFIATSDSDKPIIVFQKIKPDQYITTKGISLLAKKNTFRVVSEIGISISSKIDLIYDNGKILFNSYTCARQIFDLSNFYRIATDCEVESFSKVKALSFVNREMFVENADTWVRRKLSLINDINVFEEFSVDEIVEIAKENDFQINTITQKKLKKIVVPEDKAEMKNLLKFLDEDIYKGYFTKNTYETNSKRKYKK